LNKLEFPPSKDDLCQVFLKLAKCFCRIYVNDLTPFLYFCDYLPFGDDLAIYLNRVEFPSSKNNLY
jgi:hypothetical protein